MEQLSPHPNILGTNSGASATFPVTGIKYSDKVNLRKIGFIQALFKDIAPRGFEAKLTRGLSIHNQEAEIRKLSLLRFLPGEGSTGGEQAPPPYQLTQSG